MSNHTSEDGNSRTVPSVVVGVGGSAGSTVALRWAVAEARLRDAPLRAVHAWTSIQPLIPPLLGFPSSAVSVDSSVDDLRRTAEQVLEWATDELREMHDATVERVLGEGSAAHVLIDAVGEDDLLVVGSRGHGGFVDLLFGSVS